MYKSFFSGRVGIRTPNLLIRSEMLYPVELRNPFPFGTAKVEIVFKIRNIQSKKLYAFQPKITNLVDFKDLMLFFVLNTVNTST